MNSNTRRFRTAQLQSRITHEAWRQASERASVLYLLAAAAVIAQLHARLADHRVTILISALVILFCAVMHSRRAGRLMSKYREWVDEGFRAVDGRQKVVRDTDTV